MSCSMKWKMATAKTLKITRDATTPWTRTLLPGSEQLATLMDGPGERSAARRAARDVVPSVLGALGNVESVAKDDPEARRQHVGTRRRAHHRTQLHAFAQKGASGESSGQSDQGRRPHSPSRRLRGTTAVLRVHLPKALEIPQSITGLNVGQTTHRFPRRGIQK